VTTFLHERLQEPPSANPDRSADAMTGSGELIAARLMAPGGLLDRYKASATYAACAPAGLEQAWELVAATLAVQAADLAEAWADHPDFDPSWRR
jgi:hypothetical protein